MNKLREPLEGKSSDLESKVKMENLTKSVNNMLSRQTVKNNLMFFNGSSCLKWPIYVSQHNFSNAACNFSPDKHVLRFNNNFVGEARKTAEMILITASKPDEILDMFYCYENPIHCQR